MELNTWKSILGDWVIQTGFFHQPSFSVLEDSNLDAFFKAYSVKIQNAKITEDNVYAFLKQRFPNFSFHHFDDDGLCSAEFVYVYSLLLHFGCVQCRDVHIQNACKALGEFQQAAVASFFNKFGSMKYEAVTRGNLKKMIIDAIRTDVQVAEGVARSTPKKRITGSPDTPKNRRLELNIRELNKVRIQLETERYEKGFLEIQIKEGQEQIDRLQAQQKTHIHELHELRNQLMYENDENKAPNLKDQELRSTEMGVLKKNISQLEDKVANLLVETHCLEADKGTLAKKLKHSEEQIQVLFERSEEMTLLVDQLRIEVIEKTQTIVDLTETNEQLQMMLNEYKAAGNPLDMNSTSDFSFSKHSEAGESETSGMNLAKSVIDIQLKEKQLENEKLIGQIQQIEESKKAMEAEMEEFLNNNDYKLDDASFMTASPQEDRTEVLLDCLLKHFSSAINDMDQLKAEMDKQVIALSAQRETLDKEIESLSEVISDKTKSLEAMAEDLARAEEKIQNGQADHQAELEDLRGNCNSLQSANDNLSVDNRSYQATIQTLEEDIFIKVNELRELNMANERHKDKYTKLKYEHENSNRAIQELNAELEGQRKELETVSSDYETLRERHAELENNSAETERQLKETRQTLEDQMTEKKKCVEELETQVKQLKENNSIIEEVTTCLNEEIQTKNQEIKQLAEKVKEESDKLEKLREELKDKEAIAEEEIQTLKQTLEESRALNEQLRTENMDVDQILTEREAELASSAARQVDLNGQCEELKEKISEAKSEIESLDGERNALKDQVSQKISEIEQITSLKLEIESQLAEKTTQVAALEAEKTRLASDVSEKDSLIVEFEKSLKSMEEATRTEISNLSSQLTKLAEEKATLEHHNTELDEEIKESVVMMANLEEKVKFASEEMEKMHEVEKELQKSVAEKAQTIQDVFHELELVTISKRELSVELHGAIGRNEEQKETISALESDLKEQTLQKETLAQQVATMNEEIFNKSTNITNLQTEVVNIKDTIEDLGNTIAGLNEEIQERDSKIIEKEVEVKTAHDEIHKLQDELTATQKDKAEMEIELRTEKESLEALQTRCDDLMDLSEEDSQKIDELQMARDELQEKLRLTEVALEDKEQALSSVQEGLKESLEGIAKLNLEIAEKSEQITLQRVEIDDLRTMTDEMDKNIGELHEKLIEKATVIVGLETKVQELSEEKETLQAAFDQEKQLVEKQREDVGKMQEMINLVNEQVDKFQQSSEASKQALDKQLTEKIEQIGDLEVNLKKITEDRNALQETVHCLTESVQTNALELAKISEELEMTKSLQVTTEGQKQKAEKEKNNLVVELEETNRLFNEKVQQAAEELEQLNKDHNVQLDQMMEPLKEQISSLEENVSSLNDKISALSEETIELKEAKESLLTQRDDLRAECIAEVAKGEEIRQKSEEVEKLRDELYEKVLRIQARLEEMSCSVAEKDDFINRNVEQLREMETRIAEFQSNVDATNQQFAKVKEESDELKWQLVAKEEEQQQKDEELAQLRELAKEWDVEKGLLEEQLDEIAKEKLQIKAACDQLQSDAEVLKTVSNQKEFNLQAELDKLNEEKQHVNQQIAELNEEAVVREQRIATLTEEVENIRSELAIKTEAHDSVVDEIEKRKSTILTLEEEQRTLQQEKETLNVLINKLTKENRVVELQLGECETKLAEINEECDALKTRHAETVEQLQQDLEEVRAERRTLLETNRQHERKMLELGAEVVEKERKVSLLMTDLHKNELGQMEESSKINLLLNKIESYKTDEVKLQELENLHHREKEINKKLTTDVEILCAKLAKNRKETEEKEKEWREERRTLAAKVHDQENVDERMKDYRLEMEGKLEKMKEKMKTLYNEEMGKLKSKHERDLFEMRKEVTTKKQKLDEYEAQCRKFSSQIRSLNERQLDMYKENEFMKNKLKMMDGQSDLQRSSALSRSHRMLPPSSSMLSVSNLKMEDEEGEVFNNTYLIDLKNGGGRTSPSRESICLSELQHRNSMVPRHLRSTYSVQYGDQGYREEDLLNSGGLGLDDSMSSLLNTGQRKKVGGTTSYKRPGPPTPSKNGGRLSFGGTGGSVVGRLSLGGTGYDSLSQREALKEFNENTGSRKSITKETPGKVLGGLFGNSSKVRNENATPKKRLSIFRNKK